MVKQSKGIGFNNSYTMQMSMFIAREGQTFKKDGRLKNPQHFLTQNKNHISLLCKSAGP